MALTSAPTPTPTNTPTLTMASDFLSSPNTTPPSSSVLVSPNKNTPLRMNEYFQSPVIKVFIGPDRVFWNIPRALLLARVPYLDQILKPSSPENETAGIILNQEEPPIFAHVVDWFLTGEVYIHRQHDENESEPILPLFALHAFAQRFRMKDFAEAVMNQIKTCLHEHHCLPTAVEIHEVFSAGSDDTSMKRLMVKRMVDAFLEMCPQELFGQLERWSEIIASHPEFTAKFLMAAKVRFDCLGFEVEDAKDGVAKKRKREDEKKKDGERSGELEAKKAKVIDLTS